MKKGYINRVSVSQMNLKRLKEEGWLSEKDGVITSPHKAIQAGLRFSFFENGKDKDAYELLPKDVSTGRAYKEGKEKQLGGIESQMGVLLRLDGFYNDVICYPSKDQPRGVILEKVKPENIVQPLEKDKFPKTVDKLIAYGVVEHQDAYSSNFQYIILKNFNGGKSCRYYVEYSPRDLQVLDFEEVPDSEREIFKIYVESRRAASDIYEFEDLNGVDTVHRAMPSVVDLRQFDKTSLFYKKLIVANKKTLEDFVAAPVWDLGGYIYFATRSLSEASEETLQEREEVVGLVTAFRNAFLLASEAGLDIPPEQLGEIEKRFMNQLYSVLCDGLKDWRRINDGDRVASIVFLKKVFRRP